MLRLFFKHKLIGNIGISLISGITALSLAGVAMQMGYSNFKLKAEKQLHILNSIDLQQLFKLEWKNWVDLPLTNDSTTITLSEIDINYQLSTNLKNPSLTSQNYNPDSAIIIENTNGKINFYCTLIERLIS